MKKNIKVNQNEFEKIKLRLLKKHKLSKFYTSVDDKKPFFESKDQKILITTNKIAIGNVVYILSL